MKKKLFIIHFNAPIGQSVNFDIWLGKAQYTIAGHRLFTYSTKTLKELKKF